MSDPPSRLGPYQVLETIGRGGMGVVYRARHAGSGAIVALKTVSVPNHGVLQSLRREIHVLQGIQHPGVVRVLDQGVEGGLPWYAMELLSGRSLRASRYVPDDGDRPTVPLTSIPTELTGSASTGADSPTGPPPSLEHVPAILSLCRRLCDPLGYLHGEGIVHRDLKPDNILIRHDGRPVIVDFGLMSRFADDVSRESAEALGELGGTVWYVAPEQAQGEMVDARADLYSLGCILYELLTGSPPFVGATAAAILVQHVTQEPRPPSSLVPGLTAAVDQLVMGLLEKSPRHRFGHADTVARALSDILGPDDPAPPTQTPRAFLYRPRLAGREPELERVLALLDRLPSEGGTLVIVEGESGVGKTRLALEVSRRASGRGLSVLSGSGNPGTAAPLGSLAGLLQAMADRCRELGETETERLLGGRLKVLASYAPTLLTVPGADRILPPEELPEAAARLRLSTYLAESLEALTQTGPLVFLLDDLQWVDELTLTVLQAVSRRLDRTRLLLLATVRSGELDIDGLRASSHVVRLGRLQTHDLTEMVGDMLASDPPPPGLCRYLDSRSEGVPLFVAEYLRTAVAEGLLVRDRTGRWTVKGEQASPDDEGVYEDLALPASIEAILSRRLDVLSVESLAVARAAAVIGREVENETLLRVADLPEESMLAATRELLRRQVLEEGSEGRLRFIHERLREVVYAGQSGPDRTELHRRVAQVLEQDPSGPGVAARLGYHWEQAGDPKRATPRYLEAARDALGRYALDDAERLYRSGIRLGKPGQTIEARLDLAVRVMQARGRLDEADGELEQARAEAEQSGDTRLQTRVLRAQADIARMKGYFGTALRLAEDAWGLARELQDRSLEGDVCRVLAVIHHQGADTARAVQYHLRSIALARETADHYSEAISLGNLAITYRDLRLIEPALRAYQESRDYARRSGALRIEGVANGNLATLRFELGDFEEAGVLLREALAISRRVGDRYSESIHLSNLAEFEARVGDPVRAKTHLEEALSLNRDLGQEVMESSVALSKGELCVREGELDTAQAMFERARRLLQKHASRGANHSEVLLARVALLRGQVDESDRQLKRLESLGVGAGNETLDFEARLLRIELTAERGGSPRSQYQELLDHARTMTSGETVLLRAELERVARTVDAVEAGLPILGGKVPEDHPPALRRYLEGRIAP